MSDPVAAFELLAPTAPNHFLLHFYAAVSRVLAFVVRSGGGVGTDEQAFGRDAFLDGYRAELRELDSEAIDASWWERAILGWESRALIHLPIRAAAEATDLDFDCRLGLVLLSLAEIDSRFGTLFAELQQPMPYRRPTLETLGHLLAKSSRENGSRGWDIGERLLQSGTAIVMDAGAARSEWQLRIPPVIWDLLQGRKNQQPQPWSTIHDPSDFPSIDELPLPLALRRQLAQVPRLIETGQVSAIVLRGTEGSDRLRIVGSVAAAMGRGVAEIALPVSAPDPDTPTLAQVLPALGPLAVMARCLPALTLDLGPGESVDLPRLPANVGGLGILMGREGGIRGEPAERAMTLSIPPPTPAERRRLWASVLATGHVDDLDALVNRYHLPIGYIRQAATMSLAHAAMDGRDVVTSADVAAATRSINRQQLDTLAMRVETHGHWGDVVVMQTTEAKLRDLELRCRHREQLLDHLGPAFRSTTNRGVRALFSGASGTGKTLAATVLASVVGLDLYRVDLSAVVNKYIGETEKNLNRVLSRAEELDVVLLLDEGDSLLGSRTDVKSANDRYANLETNYLLQRLEGYEGIVIVTTNANQLIDRSFLRRIDMVVNFVPPGPTERAAIWDLHLPIDSVASGPFLADVSLRCSLTGGQIRNAALAATLLAMDQGVPTGDGHLLQAIEGEYRKAGALSPFAFDRHERLPQGDVASFIDALQGRE